MEAYHATTCFYLPLINNYSGKKYYDNHPLSSKQQPAYITMAGVYSNKVHYCVELKIITVQYHLLLWLIDHNGWYPLFIAFIFHLSRQTPTPDALLWYSLSLASSCGTCK